MSKWIFLFCGLAILAGSVRAMRSQASTTTIAGKEQVSAKPSQNPQSKGSPPSSEAEPRVVAGDPKMELDAKEPRGLSLKGKGGSLRIEWGATRQKLSETMASLSGLPPADRLKCSEFSGEILCFLAEDAPWQAQIGTLWYDKARPALLFAPDGRLYHCQLNFPKGDLKTVRSALEAKFGAPTAEDQNQKMIAWQLPQTAIVLQEEYPGNPEESALGLVYLPIAKTTQ